LGNLDQTSFEAIAPKIQQSSVELGGGEILFREGDPSDSLYLLMSGRLQAIVTTPEGRGQIVGEIGRGESVGEMGLFSAQPRTATVMAVRDSVLARIELAVFREILKEAPTLALNLNRVIIERLQRRNSSQKPERNVTNIAVVSVSAGLKPRTIPIQKRKRGKFLPNWGESPQIALLIRILLLLLILLLNQKIN
jgi:NTE family protein